MLEGENGENPPKIIRKAGMVIVGVSALPEMRLELMREIESRGLVVAVVKDEDLTDAEKIDQLADEVRKQQACKKDNKDFADEIEAAMLSAGGRLLEDVNLILGGEKEKHPVIKEIKRPVKRQDYNNMAKMRKRVGGR